MLEASRAVFLQNILFLVLVGAFYQTDRKMILECNKQIKR